MRVGRTLNNEPYHTPLYRELTPEDSKARHMARPAYDEKQADLDAAFVPSGRKPRIVCLICGKGPLDGVALFRREGAYRCSDHLIVEDGA